jgi:hypothetical protein
MLHEKMEKWDVPHHPPLNAQPATDNAQLSTE